jgi:hypothetical protein
MPVVLMDLRPLPPCPCSRTGSHDLSAIVPSEDDGDVTLFCDHCGIVRRLPVKGALGRPLDDYTGATIADRAREG